MKTEEVIQRLKEKKETIATMESCTGGALVSEITHHEGASEIIEYSAVTYSNHFKEVMGVDPEVMKKYTVYSKETAKEMAMAICRFANSTIGVGITGKLNREDEQNKTGSNSTVFICIYHTKREKCFEYTFEVERKAREENKADIVAFILEKLLEVI